MQRIFRLALGACLLLAGCTTATGQSAPPPPASISPAPIDSPQPTASPEPSPSESAVPTEPAVDSVPIPADTYAIVTATDLRVRSKPGISDDSKKLEPLLQDGVELVVLDGPVDASGYNWYLVQPTTEPAGDVDPYPFGWVAAAGKDGEPWIAPKRHDCPKRPTDLESVWQGGYEALVCFGGEDITFPARIGLPEIQCGAEAPWGTDPEWLDSCISSGGPIFASIDAQDDALMWPIWAPGVETLELDYDTPQKKWPIVEVTGLFDHPDAKTCRSRANYEEPGFQKPSPDWVVLQCRLEFVVTSVREIDG